MKKTTHYIDSVFYQFEQTARYCKYLSVQIFQGLNMGITADEFIVLDTIDANGCICQRELAQLILKDRAGTGRLLNTLEEKGYIERFADTKNNRLVRKMKLTKSGIAILKDTIDKLKKYIDKMPEIISEENKEKLISAIIEFRQGLEKEVQMNI